MSDERDQEDIRARMAAALRAAPADDQGTSWWQHVIPTTPGQAALLAASMIPGRLGRIALAGSAAGAVMNPGDALGALRDATRSRPKVQ